MKRAVIAAMLAIACTTPVALAQSQTQAPMPRVGMINVLTTDLDRSERFYREAFGFDAPRVYNPRERVFTLDPNGARIELVLTDTPHGNSGFTLLVADVDAVVARTAAAGGTVVRMPGAPANNYRTAVITDPDGSEIEVLQPMPRP